MPLIQVTINNDDPDDIFVTVNDLNTAAGTTVLDKARLIYRASTPVDITMDGGGDGNISWLAVLAKDSTVSKAGNATPRNGDQIDVAAQ